MPEKILPYAKAWASLIVALATALTGIFAADSTVGRVLTIVLALATAITVWRVPNSSPTDQP